LGWHDLTFDFAQDSVSIFRQRLEELLGGRVDQDLLRIELTGSLGMEVAQQLEQTLESLEARLLRLQVANRTVIAPKPDEVAALTQRARDPLTTRVAARLLTLAAQDSDQSEIARLALRELYAACHRT
jgi:hypothetical protein